MQQWKNIRDQRQFWCDDMVYMYGAIHGRRPKHSKHRYCSYHFTFTPSHISFSKLLKCPIFIKIFLLDVNATIICSTLLLTWKKLDWIHAQYQAHLLITTKSAEIDYVEWMQWIRNITISPIMTEFESIQKWINPDWDKCGRIAPFSEKSRKIAEIQKKNYQVVVHIYCSITIPIYQTIHWINQNCWLAMLKRTVCRMLIPNKPNKLKNDY